MADNFPLRVNISQSRTSTSTPSAGTSSQDCMLKVYPCTFLAGNKSMTELTKLFDLLSVSLTFHSMEIWDYVVFFFHKMYLDLHSINLVFSELILKLARATQCFNII
jgi:hypothetical protein